MRPLVFAAVMVKNEVDNVGALLESARAHVDGTVVTDTGSTDGTQDAVRAVGAPVEFHEEKPIVSPLRNGKMVFDFSDNRNRVLDLIFAREDKPVFSLFLGGHETLHVDGDALRKFLEEHRDAPDGAYCIEMRSGSRSWPYTRVLRTDGEWCYYGKRHECPVGPNGETRGPLIPGVYIEHAPPVEDRDRKLARLRDEDMPILEDTVGDESLSLEARAGSMLFLAETHMFLAIDMMEQTKGKIEPGTAWLSHQMAAMALYWRYAQLGEQPNRPGYDPHKVHYAFAQYYSIAGQIPGLYTHAEIAVRLEMLAKVAPKMPEARWLLAAHLAKAAEAAQSPSEMKIALWHAIEASKLAKAAQTETSYEITETALTHRALVLAADCADFLRQSAKSQEERIQNMSKRRKLLTMAVKEGAPKELLERLENTEAAG